MICVEAMRIGDAVGESDDDGPRDEANGGAEAGKSHGQQDDSGHQRDHGEAGQAEAGDDAGDDDDECAGGSADLGARAAQGGDEKTGDDGGVESGLRRDSRGDAKGHGERQRDQADGDAGKKVVQEHLPAVLAQRQDQLGQVGIAEGHDAASILVEFELALGGLRDSEAPR